MEVKKKKPSGIKVTFQELTDSIPYMSLTPAKREFAKAVLRAALTYVAMKRAGYELAPPKK